MHDYSGRKPLKNQEVPNDQQQFNNDWNLAHASNNPNQFNFNFKSPIHISSSTSSLNKLNNNNNNMEGNENVFNCNSNLIENEDVELVEVVPIK